MIEFSSFLISSLTFFVRKTPAIGLFRQRQSPLPVAAWQSLIELPTELGCRFHPHCQGCPTALAQPSAWPSFPQTVLLLPAQSLLYVCWPFALCPAKERGVRQFAPCQQALGSLYNKVTKSSRLSARALSFCSRCSYLKFPRFRWQEAERKALNYVFLRLQIYNFYPTIIVFLLVYTSYRVRLEVVPLQMI